jgi:hypothetical protein
MKSWKYLIPQVDGIHALRIENVLREAAFPAKLEDNSVRKVEHVGWVCVLNGVQALTDSPTVAQGWREQGHEVKEVYA